MEIVYVSPDGAYEEYEELTFRKDQLEKEAELIHRAYLREFGDLLTEGFRLKIACIALKKEIAAYVLARNAGKPITREEVEAALKRQMAGYYHDLDRMIKENEAGKKGSALSYYEADQVKRLYRKLAKLLHPDISPLTHDYPALAELFNRIIDAYKRNDLKELQKLEVLVHKELEENGVEGFQIVIPDAAARIGELEADIDRILHSEPYTLRELLKDEDAVAEKKAALEEDIRAYREYEARLTEECAKIRGERNE